MKKIIAILTALAVVSMAFAQTVDIKNTVETKPVVKIGNNNWELSQWGFDGDRFLREEVSGTATTLDERAVVWGRARLDVKTRDTAQTGILNVKPQWQFANDINAAALIKPLNGLEIHVGSHEGANNKSFGPGIAWKQDNLAKLGIKNVTGNWEGVQEMKKGIYAGWTGIDNLWIGAGIATEWGENAGTTTTPKSEKALIKKGAFGPFQVGASYDTDAFGVGAKYIGQFGGFNGAAGTEGDANPSLVDSKYTHHNIYAGFTFKGLQDAKVGTTIGAAVDFDTLKKSEVVGTNAYTAFAVSANADMNFRNGITDKVEVTVAYQSLDGKKAKVLPFYIGNTLGYKVSDDASFSLYTAYMQAGLINAIKKYETGVNGAGDDGILGRAANANLSASLIVLDPEFTFSMGSHTFSFGVETQVANDMKYQPKTSTEWSYTSIHGMAAQVAFPVKWTYQF